MSQAAINTRENEAKVFRRNRNNGTQLAGLIFLCVVLGTVVWGGVMVVSWMNDPERLPLSRLVVTGERHYTTNDDIRQAIMSLGVPGTFMTQDVNIIQQQIEHLAWIQQVSVRKQWPDELKIHVVEYDPVARWNDQQMVNDAGESFSLPVDRVKNLFLPLLYGPDGSGKEVLEGYREINTILSVGKFRIKSIMMSARRSWQLILDNGVRLELGRNDRINRLQRFMQLYPVLLHQEQTVGLKVEYIDLRYETGASVGWASAPVAEPTGSKEISRDKVTH